MASARSPYELRGPRSKGEEPGISSPQHTKRDRSASFIDPTVSGQQRESCDLQIVSPEGIGQRTQEAHN
jgi:hypothetical protein